MSTAESNDDLQFERRLGREGISEEYLGAEWAGTSFLEAKADECEDEAGMWSMLISARYSTRQDSKVDREIQREE